MDEFSLIDEFFRAAALARDDVALGIGDDAALLRVPPGVELVAALDTLVAGRHFPLDFPPADIGYRAAAVNLSDFAAMGAEPRWALLGLTLPDAERDWLAAFAAGLADALNAAGVALVGGDTTRGPLTVSVQLLGTVASGTALRRDRAQPGDAVFVSGTPGDAAGGLACWARRDEDDPGLRHLVTRFSRPTPRLALGRALAGLATSCIDVSDGLVADLGHIAAASGCGALLDWQALPVSPELVAALGEARARELAAAGGDDYELCFTCPPARAGAMAAVAAACAVPVTRIGTLRAGQGVLIREADGSERAPAARGYLHFRSAGG
ncbi:MAG: thiamine-phosphate kinase [Gammaproteobacteria bacterium]|nr:thiamine-phosphate kinase [Gammaproteobacteria bacterium]MBI5618663.1 thiamine-phosphate kinase [Gammaproteobacteria bacterium]